MKLIVGLIGYSSSGKGTLAKFLGRRYGISVVSTGAIVRREVRRLGLSLTSENVMTVSDLMRATMGQRFMQLAVEDMRNTLEQSLPVILDSLREPNDLKTLLDVADCVKTIAIFSPSSLRYRRMASRKRAGDPTSLKQFQKLEDFERDLGISKLIESATHVVLNDGDISALYNQGIRIMETIMTQASLKLTGLQEI